MNVSCVQNPMYYALGHFSKFIPELSVRVGLEVTGYDADRVQVRTSTFYSGQRILQYNDDDILKYYYLFIVPHSSLFFFKNIFDNVLFMR